MGSGARRITDSFLLIEEIASKRVDGGRLAHATDKITEPVAVIWKTKLKPFVGEYDMKMNVGNIDRFVRALLGIALLISPLLNIPAIWSNATFAYVSMAVGLVLAVTALIGVCPLYRLIGISTCRL